jgi:hypothetical protein
MLRSNLDVCDPVRHFHKTIGEIIVLLMLMLVFLLDSKLQDQNCVPNDSKYSLTSKCS